MFRLIIITLATIFSFSAINCHAIELEEFIDKAIKNSSRLKSQFYKCKSAEKQLRSTLLTVFLPEIDLRCYSDNSFYSKKNVALNQRIIDVGSAFSAFSKSSHILKGEKMRFQQLKQEIALNAVKVYVDVLRITEILKLKEHKKRVSLEYLSTMKKRLSLGEVTNAEVLLAKAKFLSYVSEKVDAEGKLKLANIAYFHLIGEVPDKLVEVEVNELPCIPKLNECLQLAKMNSLSLKESIYQKKVAKMGVIAEIAKWLPSLSLIASIDIDQGNIENGPFKREKGKEGKVGIVFNFEVPPFKGGTNAFDISKAKMDEKIFTYDYYETVKSVEKDIVKVWNNVLTAKAYLKASQEAEKAATIALDGVKKEVHLNLKSITELFNTEDTLFKTRSDLVEAKSKYVVSIYNLLFKLNTINL